MNMMLVLAIYVVAIVAYVAFSRRRQAKAQEDRLNPGLFAYSNLLGIKYCSEPFKMW